MPSTAAPSLLLRNVLWKTLRDYRRSLLWWGSGLVAYTFLIMLFYPSFKEFGDLEELIKQMPEELLAAFMGEITDFNSAESFLRSELFFLAAPMLFVIFTVAFGSGAIAGEEGRGTLDLLLSYPMPRWRVVTQKFGAMVLATLALAALFWVGLAAGAVAVDMDISLWRLAQATLSLALLAVAFGAIALAVGCATGNRGLSWGLTGALALGLYLLNALGPLMDVLKPFYKLSPFYYYMGADPLVNGLNLVHAIVLIALAAVALAAALALFERRDVAV